ncbi:MAG: bifunctional ADP-dependent NAD(P)H-hydrate dehydratase/NAD(P)H-hydrate epimerase [Denitrovibrio sp.]|nr:MAG: bifunctional ADP-dependent NAD(P)H-hydrate dehydratase/NAD(P)H-hydrate epimerase [Denitrovibrio sp.]
MEILNSSQMAQADAYTIKEVGVPSIVLMENAAISVLDEILERIPDIINAAVVAGVGNNGGDGFAIARQLLNLGISCDVFLACDESELKGDGLINYNILKSYEADIHILCHSEQNDGSKHGSVNISFDEYDVTIDALFGTGLSRPLEGFFASLVEQINNTSSFVVAVDIPSGLSGDTHNVIGECIEADLTVTFARPKYPHALFPARGVCGEIVVTEISIPDLAVDTVDCTTFLLDEDELPSFPEREEDSHKGDHGHAVIIGGSAGKSGAVFMASRACARVGAGLTTTAVPSGLMQAAETVNAEIMTVSVGKKSHFEENGIDELVKFLKDKTVCAVGPGIGTHEDTSDFIDELIHKTKLPIIIDADGINLLKKSSYKKLKNRCILTPHIGEFAKLIGKSKEEVLTNRVELAKEFAIENEVILVLKSADTIIAIPEGFVFINITGTPALAKGGSGDCLTGLITGFVAQGFELADAACLGAYTLGRTAELVSEDMNEKSILTTDIIENIWKTIDELEENS